MIHRSRTSLLVAAAACALASATFAQNKPAEPARGDKPAAAQPARANDRMGDAYTLPTCPISGEPLGGMGDAVVKAYDGREVRFCCDKCVAGFEKDKAGSWAKVDQQMIKDQLPRYPLDTSVVSGKKLDKPVDYVWNNRLVRLAGEDEKAEFLKDTKKYIAALDKAVVEKQSKTYALKTCPMMGDPIDPSDFKTVVVANRLIEVCCGKCQGKVKRDPTKALAALDAAEAKTPAGGK